jgi:hypothetical protein
MAVELQEVSVWGGDVLCVFFLTFLCVKKRHPLSRHIYPKKGWISFWKWVVSKLIANFRKKAIKNTINFFLIFGYSFENNFKKSQI